MQRIGIMGGTFNPIHNGHLMLAREAYQQFHLDRILVMPNKFPGYKNAAELLSSDYRKAMVCLAIQDYPYMEYSDIELKREGNTYTIDTLNELHAKHPDTEYYFILGGDSLLHLHEWYQYQNILKEAVILCARRDTADYDTLEQVRQTLLQENPDAHIELLHTRMLDISSSELRMMIQEHKDITGLVPHAVKDYIEANHFYADMDAPA
jgi:nicotinate-nucleotide adenylyltransferase